MNFAFSGGKRSEIGFVFPTRIIVPWYCPGKNPALQFAGPFGANPRTSGSTTNVGRFSFMLPRPYEIHAPICGKPGNRNPEFCMYVAGPWIFDFETIEWINAISSTHCASPGTKSLTHLPHWPYGLQLHGLFMQGPGSLWNSSTF